MASRSETESVRSSAAADCSGSGARWRAAEIPDAAAELRAAGVSPRLAPLLARRGVDGAESARRFLAPSAEDLHDPFLLAGMERAVERLLAARSAGHRVAVVGDYDVDGVTASALLSAVFRACGIATLAIVPHRLEEGYGFQPLHVERALAAGCGLVVTADCGASSHAAVEAALAAGLEVVVTDHHLPASALPDGAVQVNPKQGHCAYPCPHLSGAGLALKLALALAARSGKELPLASLLRIASLGTIADLVPLVDENRTIAALGLAAFADLRSAGLKALIRRAGLKLPISAVDVGFRIGPRLNAAGRLDSAESALELLLCRDPARAAELAERLEQWNRRRQQAELRVVDEARAQIEALPRLPPLLVAWSAEWHRGVVGIAAGRLAREFHRPTILLAVDGESATGSGRSVRGIHLHDFVAGWRDRLERFGGHAQAIGLSAATGALEALRDEWQQAAAEWDPALLERSYRYEIELEPAEVGEDLLTELEALEPHGQENPRPLLKVGPLARVTAPRHFGRGHLWVPARGDDGAPVRLLGWSWQQRAAELDGRFEVLAYLERDTYRGGVSLRLVDCRPLGEPA